MGKADALYESYKQAVRIEVALGGERMPRVWRSYNNEIPSKEWKDRLADEMIRTYPEIKEYGLELQKRVMNLEDEVRKLKIENLALMESKEK